VSGVPSNLYDKVLQAGYTSPTQAIIKGFELLLKPEASANSGEAVRELQGEIEGLKSENKRLKDSLESCPNINEFIELRARYEEIKRHNETLTRELERAGNEKSVSQNLFNNYMHQIQLLITQKVITSPNSSDIIDNTATTDNDITVTNDIDNPTSTDSDIPNIKTKNKPILHKRCKYCDTPFTTTNPNKEYCKPACRTAFSRANKNL
jgi:hypothetical protein